jgi:hypothetical protein
VRESFMEAAAMVVLVQCELNCEKDRSMHGRGFSVSKKVEVVVAECRPAWQLAPLYITRRRMHGRGLPVRIRRFLSLAYAYPYLTQLSPLTMTKEMRWTMRVLPFSA